MATTSSASSIDNSSERQPLLASSSSLSSSSYHTTGEAKGLEEKGKNSSCELILSTTKPLPSNLDTLAINGNAAYVRYSLPFQVAALHKKTTKLESNKLYVNKASISSFDYQAMGPNGKTVKGTIAKTNLVQIIESRNQGKLKDIKLRKLENFLKSNNPKDLAPILEDVLALTPEGQIARQGLCYVNKATKECKQFNANAQQLAKFDARLKVFSQPNRVLSEADIQQIQKTTGHTHARPAPAPDVCDIVRVGKLNADVIANLETNNRSAYIRSTYTPKVELAAAPQDAKEEAKPEKGRFYIKKLDDKTLACQFLNAKGEVVDQNLSADLIRERIKNSKDGEVTKYGKLRNLDYFLERNEVHFLDLLRSDILTIAKIRHTPNQESLHFYNHTTKTCTLIAGSKAELHRFDTAFKTDLNRQQSLNAVQANKALLLTGYNAQATPSLPQASEWQVNNGCDIYLTDAAPTKETMKDLIFTNAAYIRFKDKLFYANKKTGEFVEFKLSADQLQRFDLELNVTSSQLRKMTDKEIKKVPNLVKVQAVTFWQKAMHLLGLFPAQHMHMTRLQKILHWIGMASSFFIAVGCGISTAGQFIAANIATGGLASVGAAALFITGAAVNWWIFKRYVSPVLIDLFGRDTFFKDENDKPLPTWKKWAIGVALLLSFSVGATFAALTWDSTFRLPEALTFLAAVSPILGPFAVLLMTVTTICMTAMMLKDIADLIKKPDIRGEIKRFLKGMVNFDPAHPQNYGKSPGRIAFERITSIVLTAIFIPLACVGLWMTMSACLPGVTDILMNVLPAGSAGVSAKVISLGLAFLGQIPFCVQVALQTIDKLFAPKKTASQAAESTASMVLTGMKLGFVASNGLGNGIIAMNGAPPEETLTATAALVTGTGNSVFAGVPAVLGSGSAPTPLEKPVTHELDSGIAALIKLGLIQGKVKPVHTFEFEGKRVAYAEEAPVAIRAR